MKKIIGTEYYYIRNVRTWKILHCPDNNNLCVYNNENDSNKWKVEIADVYQYGKDYYHVNNSNQ